MNINIARQLQAIKDGTFAGMNVVLGADTDSTGFVSAPGRHNLSDSTLEPMNKAYDLLKAGEIVPAANFNGHAPDDFPGL